MDEREQRRRCERLRSLHVPGHPVVLPNAWDAASARAVAAAGFAAVATTSAGVAAALGYEDHEGAPAAEMFAAAARIARSVALPVTVDAESGYGLAPDELIAALSGAGAVGCNLEDTDHGRGELRDVDAQAERLAAVRRAADAVGYPLVVNARLDVFLRAEGEQLALVDDALLRAEAYAAAGVDCVYPILLHDRAAIEAFVAGCPTPINVLASPLAPTLRELAELGVARVSYGSSIHTGSMQELAAFLEGRRDRLGGVLSPGLPA